MLLSLRLRTGTGSALLLAPPDARGMLVDAHGAGNDRLYSFAPFFEQARRHGFQILSLDLPGHGRENTSVFEVAHAVADVADAIQLAFAAAPNPDLPWVLVGNSLGGALALRAVCETPLRPSGVIAVGMPTRLALGLGSMLEEVPSLLSPAMRSYRAHVAGWREVFPAFGPFRRDEFPVRCDRPRYLDAVAEVLNRPWDDYRADVPIRLIQGNRDAVARLDETRAWVGERQNAGNDVALDVVPGVGHLDVMLDPRVQAAAIGWATGRVAGFP